MKNINWPWVMIISATIGIWYSIFTNGFFTTIIGLVIGSSIAGIILKLKEDTRV
tara:strand:- start:297 stop:458 length:162 start_codon:yes stop_codon:yes gene_type:complete